MYSIFGKCLSFKFVVVSIMYEFGAFYIHIIKTCLQSGDISTSIYDIHYMICNPLLILLSRSLCDIPGLAHRMYVIF